MGIFRTSELSIKLDSDGVILLKTVILYFVIYNYAQDIISNPSSGEQYTKANILFWVSR
jgi:hypothetical protein